MRQIPGADEPYVWNGNYKFYIFPVLDTPQSERDDTPFSMIALPWVTPFLPEMGLPEPIVQQPQLFGPIYENMMTTYDVLHKMGNEALDPWSAHEYYKCVAPKAALKSIMGALQEISESLGKAVAVDFEHWLRRHFLCSELETAMFAWRFVLQDGCLLPDPDDPRRIPPPPFMNRFFARIVPLVWQDELLEERLKQAMPTPSAEQLAMSDGEILLSGAARLVERAILQESTMESLKILADDLNEAEKQEFISWAKQQADAMTVTKAKRLHGDTFLRVERPFAESPSLLDVPATTELIDHYYLQKQTQTDTDDMDLDALNQLLCYLNSINTI